MAEGKASGTTPTTDELLKVLIAMAGRLAIPPDRLRDIVSPSGSRKYIEAYNLCDGRLGVTDVARAVGLDKSNLNKSVTRWLEAGAVFKVGGTNLLHIYHLPAELERGSPPVEEEDIEVDKVPAPSRTQPRARTSVKRRMTAKPLVSDAGGGTSNGGNVESSVIAPALELALGEPDSQKEGST